MANIRLCKCLQFKALNALKTRSRTQQHLPHDHVNAVLIKPGHDVHLVQGCHAMCSRLVGQVKSTANDVDLCG